jgi:hypothetical protein
MGLALRSAGRLHVPLDTGIKILHEYPLLLVINVNHVGTVITAHGLVDP